MCGIVGAIAERNIVPPDHLQEKVLSNVEEVLARGGEVFVLGCQDSLPKVEICLAREGFIRYTAREFLCRNGMWMGR